MADRSVWPAMGIAACVAVALGTRLSLSDPVSQFLSVTLTLLGVGVLVALPGVAVLALTRTGTPASRFGMLIVGSGAVALVDFWAWIWSPDIGRAFAIAMLTGSLGIVWWRNPRVLLDEPELVRPLQAGVVVALLFTGLAYSAGGLGGDHWLNGSLTGSTVLAVSYRYWLAPDNTIPLIFAQHVFYHVPLTRPILGGGWQLSDRPPLQTAFTLTVFPLFGRQGFGYQFLGTVLQSTWVPALWILLRSRGFSERRVLVAVSATALTGAVFVNTVFVWPKMLAATCCLAALAILLEGGSLALAGSLAAMAFLSHGGIAFSLIALLPVAWKCRPHIRRIAATLASIAAFWLPWFAFQHFIDPPGDRLLKWQLAGAVAPDHNSFLHDLVVQYAADPWRDVLNKLHNVQMLVGTPNLWHGAGFIGAARSAQVTSTILAAGPLLLGAVAWLYRRRVLKAAAPLVTFIFVSLAAWVLLLFGNAPSETVFHQGSYAVPVLGIALLALAGTYLPRPMALAVLGGSVVWFVVAWVVEYVPSQPGILVRADWPMVVLAVCALLCALAARPELRRLVVTTVPFNRANPPTPEM